MLSTMTAMPKDSTPWTSHHDLVVRIASAEVAAEKLGRSLEAVMARRRELGIPEPPRKLSDADGEDE
jgi:hypothetical protein